MRDIDNLRVYEKYWGKMKTYLYWIQETISIQIQIITSPWEKPLIATQDQLNKRNKLLKTKPKPKPNPSIKFKSLNKVQEMEF